ncbi:MAG: DUF1059 domain-containing protein [Candidatus Ranarchaeia archaeon]|jgi:predicted small metal-binding protein
MDSWECPYCQFKILNLDKHELIEAIQQHMKTKHNVTEHTHPSFADSMKSFRRLSQ